MTGQVWLFFFFNVTKRKWRPSRLPEQFLLCATQTGCATFSRNIFVFEAVVVFVFAAEKEKKLIIKYRHILEGEPAAADIIWAWIVILVEGVADRDFTSLSSQQESLYIFFFGGSSFCCHRNKTTDVPWLLQSLLLFLLLPSLSAF